MRDVRRRGYTRWMLREISDGALVRHGRRWRLARGDALLEPSWSTRRVRALQRAQLVQPVALVHHGSRCIWVFEGRFYTAQDNLDADDVLALIRERELRARRRLERAHATLAQDDGRQRRREPIAPEVRRAVFERDGGRCVRCGSDFDIQYDHVIPFSLGGAATVQNLQVLCATCNKRKGTDV